MLLPHVLNSAWSAECASIVIEVVNGILLSSANNYMPVNSHSGHNVVLMLQIGEIQIDRVYHTLQQSKPTIYVWCSEHLASR